MNETLKKNIRLAFDNIADEPRLYVWISVLLALVLLCAYALLAALVTSMEILEFSIKIPWAAMIATYVFLVASGSGLCIINALGAVFGMHRYELMAKRMAFLSLTTIVFGMLCILMHLGHPERMPIYNAISPNFHSAISWMGALYSVYLVFVTVELWMQVRPDIRRHADRTEGLVKKVLRELTLDRFQATAIGRLLDDPRLPRVIGTLAFVIGAAALSMLGSVFAHSESRLLWYGPYYPVYFLVSAIFCGYALLMSVAIISHRVQGHAMLPEVKDLIFEMARVLALLLAVSLLLITCRLALSLFDPASRGPVMLLLKGPFSLGFWGFEIGLMSVLPVPVLLWAAKRKSLGGTLTGALMVLVGAYVMRYQFVVAGQVFPNIREGLPSYLPTIMEIFVISGVFGIFLLIYTLGERFLSLQEKASGPGP
jgi:Ni/Fe-hydrogenase subunit HybB-like protein